MFCPRLLLSAASAVVGVAVFADGVEWPSDFWTQVTNHVTAVAPAQDQVKSSAEKGDWDYLGACVDVVCGTAENPFDSRLCAGAVSAVTAVRSYPAGLVLNFR